MELTFGTAADDDMVFSYRIELLMTVRRYSGSSHCPVSETPDVDDMPDTHSVTLSGVRQRGRYLKVTALIPGKCE